MKKQLTLEQRYKIEVTYQSKSQEEVGELIGKHKSVVNRELKRNSINGVYKAKKAQEICNIRKKEIRSSYKFTVQMQKEIDKALQADWSPEEITGRFKKEKRPVVSHERIYQYIRNNKIK